MSGYLSGWTIDAEDGAAVARSGRLAVFLDEEGLWWSEGVKHVPAELLAALQEQLEWAQEEAAADAAREERLEGQAWEASRGLR